VRIIPYLIVAYTFFFRKNVFIGLIGLAAGNIYHFLRDVAPGKYNLNILRTPSTMYGLIHNYIKIRKLIFDRKLKHEDKYE
jgi:hypothetical protein